MHTGPEEAPPLDEDETALAELEDATRLEDPTVPEDARLVDEEVDAPPDEDAPPPDDDDDEELAMPDELLLDELPAVPPSPAVPATRPLQPAIINAPAAQPTRHP